MSVTYKDIDLLSEKSSLAGTEKLPVSDTEYITPQQIIDQARDKCIRTMDQLTPTVTDGKYLGTAGTTEYESSSYAIWRFTGIEEGQTYLLGGYYPTSVTNIYMIFWYDTNGNRVGRNINSGASGENLIAYRDKALIAPAGAVSCAVNVYKNWQNWFHLHRCNLDLAKVALSGSYNDLADKPTIPNITISSSEPTAQDGSNGDIWIVV